MNEDEAEMFLSDCIVGVHRRWTNMYERDWRPAEKVIIQLDKIMEEIDEG